MNNLADSNTWLIVFKINLMAETTEEFSSPFGNWNTSLANSSFNFDEINNDADFYGEVETYWMAKVMIVYGSYNTIFFFWRFLKAIVINLTTQHDFFY